MHTFMIKISTNKSNMVQPCQHVFRGTNVIIIKEYNSTLKLSDRIYVILKKIVIRKNARFGCCTCGMWDRFIGIREIKNTL